MYYFNPTLTQFNAPYGMGVYGTYLPGPQMIPGLDDMEADQRMVEETIEENIKEGADLECPYGKEKVWNGMRFVCQEPLPKPPEPKPKDSEKEPIKLSTVLLVATPVVALVGFLIYRKYN